jgi:hypothetical protein
MSYLSNYFCCSTLVYCFFAKLGKTWWGKVALGRVRRGLKCYSVFAKNVSVFALSLSFFPKHPSPKKINW